MPFTVQQLIEGCREPIALSPTDPAREALKLMTRNDYSQLPVVDAENRPLGLVTSDSTLNALTHFGVGIDDLRVSAAMVKHRAYTADDDLSELLHALAETQAVVIVDHQKQLIGIVTGYDTTEYFRRRAEDLMYVEDIEGSIKDHIRAAFTDEETGEVNEAALQAAVSEIKNPEEAELHGRFRGALAFYLAAANGGGSSSVDQALIGKTLVERPLVKRQDRDFDDLAFGDYVRLLLHPGKADRIGPLFNLLPEAIRRLLDDVRKARNVLAHFRGDISQEQRDQLRFCVAWLRQHQPPTFDTRADPSLQVYGAQPEEQPQYPVADACDLKSHLPVEEVRLIDEEDTQTVSRYAPLAELLQRQPSRVKRLQLSFGDIEHVIGGKLPESAREHRSWWANDPVGHIQSQQWLDAGWKTTGINMTQERVVFARIEDRHMARIAFFGALLTQMQEKGVRARNVNPDGTDRHVLESLPENGRPVAILVFSFARNRRFRVELYIDTPGTNQAANKRLFDALYAQKDEIEAEIREGLSWERLDDKEASRIALYHDGAVTDSEDDLLELRDWASDAMRRLDAAMRPRVGTLAGYI